jgi:hypothetical protein
MTTFQNEKVAPPAAAAIRPGRKPSGGKRILLRVIPPLVLLAIAVSVWQLVCYVILDPSRRSCCRHCKPSSTSRSSSRRTFLRCSKHSGRPPISR